MGVRIIVTIEDTETTDRLELARDIEGSVGAEELATKASHLGMMAAHAAIGTTPGVPF
jgi:hypothetical protein